MGAENKMNDLFFSIKWYVFLEMLKNDHNIEIKSVLKEKSLFMKIINLFLSLFSITKNFMTNFTTVIGNTVYVHGSFLSIPDDKNMHMSELQIYIYFHEIIHIMQRKRYGKLKFYFNYLFSQKFRNSAEIEAYCVNLFIDYLVLRDGHQLDVDKRKSYSSMYIKDVCDIVKNNYRIKDKKYILYMERILTKFADKLYDLELQENNVIYNAEFYKKNMKDYMIKNYTYDLFEITYFIFRKI